MQHKDVFMRSTEQNPSVTVCVRARLHACLSVYLCDLSSSLYMALTPFAVVREIAKGTKCCKATHVRRSVGSNLICIYALEYACTSRVDSSLSFHGE